MLRLAWFTPVGPSRSGIAAYNAELLPLLAGRYDIEVFTSPARHAVAAPGGYPPIFEAHDFSWRHFRAPYDLVVYQLGNARCHEFMWPYLIRYPGLTVLHDAQLHHSRALFLLDRGRLDDYRAEFRANHPDAPVDTPELVIGDIARSSYYFWPMLRLVLQTARLAAVHGTRLAADLADQCVAEVAAIRMGVADPHSRRGESAASGERDPGRGRRIATRSRRGIPPEAVVFTALGLITPEKRISPVLRAMAWLARADWTAHLLLVGGEAAHYDVRAEARSLGLDDRLTITGYVPDEEVDACLEASDVCLCLRWPTGRETSASWLRAIAAGRATVVTDLAHADDVPSLDPRTWTVLPSGSGAWAGPVAPRPARVSIDIMDEDHSLGLAMRRLATNATLREELGLAARAYWETHHTLPCMVDDYARIIDRAMARPAVPPRAVIDRHGLAGAAAAMPAHFTADGTELVRRLTAAMGVEVDFLAEPDASGTSRRLTSPDADDRLRP